MFVSLISCVIGTDINKYQDEVPYDSFIYNANPIIVNADTKIESGQSSSNSKVSKPGKLYVVSSDLKISKNMNWGGDTKSLVLGNSWKDTSISIIVIKHPENKPIVIEGNGNTTITFGRATLIDVQSPVIFKNVKIHRAYDGPDSAIWHYGTNKKVNFPSFQICSSSIVIRAPLTFQNCTLSTGNGDGWFCDMHCVTPCTPIITFSNNTYNIKHICTCRNSKSSIVPLIKVDDKDKSKLQSFVKGNDHGSSGNIAIDVTVLSDSDDASIAYIPIGSFNSNNGKVFYITKSNPSGNDLDVEKIQCIQFLQKYCNYPSNKNNVNFEICTSPFAEDINNEKDITKYQDTVPYDSFLFNNGQNKVNTNTSVSGRGVYVIDSDIKLTNNVNWGSNSNPLIGDSWNDTTVAVILIKHPQNKTIVIESSNNATISLEKGVIIDVQSPVIFKNVRIYRTPNAGNSCVANKSNGQHCKTNVGNDIWSGCFMARAPIKFQNCTLSTSGGTGCWSDIHFLSPYAPLVEFEDNKYETKQIYCYKNKKLSIIPLLKVSTKDISQFKSFIKTDGVCNNISVNSSMLEDINNSNVSYYPVGSFNQNNGKVFHIACSSTNITKNENNIWEAKVKDAVIPSNDEDIKQKCQKFLQKYCGLANNATNLNVTTYTSPYINTISTSQLVTKTGYINIDMEETDKGEYPTSDWEQTVKAGILPIPENSTNIAEISVGIIGTKDLKIQTSDKVNTVKLSGDWSQYNGILTIPNNITKICLSEKNIPFGINVSHNIEIDCEKSDTLNILGDLSKCTGTVSFSNKITKIFVQEDKVPFTIGGNSTISIGTTDPGIDTMKFKSDILNHKGKISVDPTIKTVTIE